MTSLARSLNGDGRKGWALAALVVLLLALAAAGASVRDALSLQRDALAAGEYWRLFTGHLVHLDLRHAVLNALGLALIWALYLRAWSAPAWGLVVLASLLAVDAGLWWLQPDVRWYVGASGVLHGLLVAGAVGQAWRGDRVERRLALLVLVALAGKLAWEHRQGASVFLAADQPVVLPAHLYGACGGLLAAAALIAIMRGLLHRAG